MNHAATPARFLSYRTFFGLIAGIIIALIYIVFFQQPGLFTPILSLMIAIWVSKLSAPKHLAALGAIISLPTGLAAGIQIMLKQIHTLDILAAISMYLGVSAILIINMINFVFWGFLFGQLLRLYRRGTLF